MNPYPPPKELRLHAATPSLVLMLCLTVLPGAPGCGDTSPEDSDVASSEPDISASEEVGYDGSDVPPDTPPDSDALTLTRLFPTDQNPAPRFDDCLFGSPLLYEGAEADTILIAAGDQVVGLEPDTGAPRWAVTLPAPEGERPMVVSTPVLVDHRLVVAYHTTSPQTGDTASPGRNVNDPRLSQLVAIVDLSASPPGLDAALPYVRLQARVPAFAQGGLVDFLPAHAMARASLIHTRLQPDSPGLVYVTFGNVRDIQPWHGWIFELDLGAWMDAGPEQAVSAVMVTTPEHDCGQVGHSGSRERVCGGGLWAPSGPLLIERPGQDPEIIVAPGNGQLDLGRGDYANTLLKVRPGLNFDPMCDPDLCQDFNPDDPDLDCIASCSDLFVPRLLPGQPQPTPESGACDGLSFFACWAALDYIGGSTPAFVPGPSGADPDLLVYPAKDGHTYLLDASHLGTMYDRLQLTEICGTPSDPCAQDWAGMIVTQPAWVTLSDGTPTLVIPTFMPDNTHPAGVFGLRLRYQPQPHLEIAWQYPDPASPQATQRYRRHPSRPVIGTFGSPPRPVVWVVDVPRGQLATLSALLVDDGTPLVEQTLASNGMRFTQPLLHNNIVYISGCGTDDGPGTLEAYQVTPR